MFILAQANQWEPTLQYGAFGLCVILVVGFLGLVVLILKIHRSERQDLVAALGNHNKEMKGLCQSTQQALMNNTEALRSMRQALGDRPCLAADSRVRGTPS